MSDMARDFGATDRRIAEAQPNITFRWTPKTAMQAILYALLMSMRIFRFDRFCVCCGSFVPGWLDWSSGYRSVLCPNCFSQPRNRLLTLFFAQNMPLRPRSSVLHFSPEPTLTDMIQGRVAEYLTTDLHERADNGVKVDVCMDITAISFPDRRFDAVICVHVLEHVKNDRKALAEIFRILRPGGWALLMAPVVPGSAATVEDERYDTPELRQRHYLQSDHVRLYGETDFHSRIAAAGFSVQTISPASFNAHDKFFGIDPGEKIILGRKPERHS